MLTLAQKKSIELKRQMLLVAKRKAEADEEKRKEEEEANAEKIRQERNGLADMVRKMREALGFPI